MPFVDVQFDELEQTAELLSERVGVARYSYFKASQEYQRVLLSYSASDALDPVRELAMNQARKAHTEAYDVYVEALEQLADTAFNKAGKAVRADLRDRPATNALLI
ncbi:MAG: hypothetical protein M3Z09_12465 [Acidobacteriota bacterium]|nr:hypothetical protein [Acidobacteriota bacterium]